ncbi:MAG: ribonuclease P protein component [Desulfobacterales bacterium]|jgi:ribonuclease P protein component
MAWDLVFIHAVPNRDLTLSLFKLSQETCPLQYTFTKADRILKRHEFIALSKSGRKIQNESFIAVFAPSRQGHSRLGITVTKKVGGAVKRNRIKRLVREFFRLNRQFLSGEWDINIIAKNQIADITSEDAYHSLRNIFDRISRYDDP